MYSVCSAAGAYPEKAACVKTERRAEMAAAGVRTKMPAAVGAKAVAGRACRDSSVSKRKVRTIGLQQACECTTFHIFSAHGARGG